MAQITDADRGIDKCSVWTAWRELDGSEGLGKQTGESIAKVIDGTYTECKLFILDKYALDMPKNPLVEYVIVDNKSGRLMSCANSMR